MEGAMPPNLNNREGPLHPSPNLTMAPLLSETC